MRASLPPLLRRWLSSASAPAIWLAFGLVATGCGPAGSGAAGLDPAAWGFTAGQGGNPYFTPTQDDGPTLPDGARDSPPVVVAEHAGLPEAPRPVDASDTDESAQRRAGPPTLYVSVARLDLGPAARSASFRIANIGGGTLGYTIVSSVAWLKVDPATGTAAATSQAVVVTADRSWLVTGLHEATITIHGDDGTAATVHVFVTKPLTRPLIIPWTQINTEHTQEDVDLTVAALQLWRRVTDTACVITGPGQAALFTELQQRVPGLHIIPSLSTSSWLGHDQFDAPDKWQKMAPAVAQYAAACGQKRVVLENEEAVWKWLWGQYEIDPDRMRQCLSYLPRDIEIVWYPTVYWSSPEAMARSAWLCQLVEEELDCRFVDMTYGDPYYNAASWVQARQVLDGIAVREVIPVIWFNCVPNWCYWSYSQVAEIMNVISGYSESLFYVGMSDGCMEAAQAITALLSP